jgi:hypothetical protein
VRPFIAVILLSCLPALAHAQVIVNQAALAQLAGITAAPAAVEPPAQPPVVRHVIRHWVVVRRTVTVAVVKPKAMVVPVVAKPVVSPAPPKPPAPLPVLALRFASGDSNLPAGAAAALKPFCAATGLVVINALAPGDPSDMSGAMRLSMARAFAVRDALTACGVPSTRIIPRAMGSVAGQDEDVTKVSTAP